MLYRNTKRIEPEKIWTEKEIELVMKHEVPDPVLSGMIGRSVQAIHMKRHKTLYEMFGYDR